MSTDFQRLKTDLEDYAAAWRADALTVRTMGGAIKFGPEEADLVADAFLEAAQAIGELLAQREDATP